MPSCPDCGLGLSLPFVSGRGTEPRWWGASERILVQTFCTRICIHCTPAAIDIITRGSPAERRAGAGRMGVTGTAGLMRADTGSRSTEHLPEF